MPTTTCRGQSQFLAEIPSLQGIYARNASHESLFADRASGVL